MASLAAEKQRPELIQKETDSFSSDYDDADQPIVYTEVELIAMRHVRAKLLAEHGIGDSRLGSKFLAVATINCKLRVDEAVAKIKTLLDLMAGLGCPEGIDDDLWKPDAAHELVAYEPAGKDFQGSTVIWINGNGRKVEKEDERHHVQACIMHYLASHADAVSLQQGITMVIDVSVAPKPPKIGNESAIQAFYQSFPQRPQAILIAGTNKVTRVLVNLAIKVASLFTKQKILDRIQFVSVDQAKQKIPLSSAPRYVGGLGGGIESTQQWVMQRLQQLPQPDL